MYFNISKGYINITISITITSRIISRNREKVKAEHSPFPASRERQNPAAPAETKPSRERQKPEAENPGAEDPEKASGGPADPP